MSKAWRGWKELSLETKLAIVIVPLFLALLSGLLFPAINRSLEGDDPPKVSGAELSNIQVERHVTLTEFKARQKTAGDPTSSSDERRESGVALIRLADRDGDLVDDAQDDCPDEAATTPNGCPAADTDRDDDNVDDAQDACPDEAATTPNGCPAADTDRDDDNVDDAQDACPDEAATTPNGCPAADTDRDDDDVDDDRDACPDRPGTANGCPVTGDRDRDRVLDAVDACPDRNASTVTGCPPQDRDGDGTLNRADNCPDEPNGDQANGDGSGRGDACELPALIYIIKSNLPPGECATDELRKAVDGDEDACPAVNLLIGPVKGKDAAANAQAVLDALRHTKRRERSGEKRQVEGVMVSFDVELKGAPGNEADVRWSLYRTKGGRVPYPWLIRHRVSEIEGQADRDMGSGDFWVPLPELRGQFKVRLEVFREKDSRLTYRESHPFR